MEKLGTKGTSMENIGKTKQRIVNRGLIDRPGMAGYMGISIRALQNYEKQGLIPVIRIGRRRLYRMESVLEALERLES